jgi:hypothetical protein
MEKMRPTFAEQDRVAAAQREKKAELIDRLTQLYAKNLTFDELVFCRGYDYGSVFNQAYENARTELEKKRR